ncbi:hypothetical protein V1477_014148 [Vespula maculifrons]|uniref:Uncharacterized protein n=1 Tax=Vespula maculifrons TaxID=7453 RepID=A0ABD2BKQ0_VESMC
MCSNRFMLKISILCYSNHNNSYKCIYTEKSGSVDNHCVLRRDCTLKFIIISRTYLGHNSSVSKPKMLFLKI